MHADPKRVVARPPRGWTLDDLLTREWLVTNGIGGYASGTIAGVNTRSQHGILTSAQPVPLGRLLMLKQVAETLTFADGSSIVLTEETAAVDAPLVHAATHLSEFRLECGLPVWRFETAHGTLEKRIVMPQRQNTVYVMYRITGCKEPVQLLDRKSTRLNSSH